LITTIKNIFNMKGPRLLHVVTKKGKGYPPAERDPVRFHSAGNFDIKTGLAAVKSGEHSLTYTDLFRDKLSKLAKENAKIVAITAAMPEGTGLDKFRDLYPQRFFDVGIAEEHAICFAAGLAREGLRPVVAIYSTFIQRAYDQIIEEVALQNLGVVLAIDRAGIVGEDGVTHQGVFDIAFLRNIPNLVVMAPGDGQELEEMLEFAVNLDKPVAIRYPKSEVPSLQSSAPSPKIQLGKAQVLGEGKDYAIIALGSMVAVAQEARGLLNNEGLTGTLINARFAKPLDVNLFKTIAAKTKFIFTVEDGISEGGFGSAVSEVMDRSVIRMGLPCEFVAHGKRSILLEKYGLSAKGIAHKIRSAIV